MFSKVLRVLARTILGVLLFCLVTGFFIIPLVLTWAIPNQGAKILKHPVRLQSVEFNPYILQLTLKGFDILDEQNKPMISFSKLLVEVSPIDLFKKIYHVKVFEIDGLKIYVELLAGNKINLLNLVPDNGLQTKVQVKVPSTTVAKSEPIPVVIIDSIDLHEGQIFFTDKTIKPNFSTTVGSIELNITNVTTNPNLEAKVKFHSNLDEKGRMSMETLIKPLAQPLQMETTFSLNDYALNLLTPYVGKYTGRELKNGKLDLSFDYRIEDNKLIANHKVLIQRFEFGNSVDSKDALHLPFGLAVALLEDTEGKIKIALPASGDMSSPKFDYKHLIFQVIHNFFFSLIAKPFSFLGSLGASDEASDELGYVRFLPGKASLSLSQQKRLLTLIKGLKEHPKLRLEIDGSYDLNADWKEIQADIFSKDYVQLRKQSTRSEGKVYQLLYQRRFGIRALWVLAKKYKEGVGEYKDEKLDQEIKRQLIEDAPPDKASLSVLAQARAQLVHDFLASHGFNEKNMNIGRTQATQSSMGYVPLQFTLTVFEP